MDKYAVIMAGGSGSRLWPLSRECRPKQFISAGNDRCMLLETIERISEVVPPENCFIITTNNLLAMTQEVLKHILPQSNILIEPNRKNTAACIAYATLILKERFGSGTLCFVPADGYVKNRKEYADALRLAFQTAEHVNELVIIGITPTYPATGYGYIQTGEKRLERVYQVEKFIEKPDLKTAEKLAADGAFLWNSGIVLGKIETILDHVRQLLPEHYEKLSEAVKYTVSAQAEAAYGGLSDISFDTGVLEKAGSIRAVKGDFDWDDIGTLDALAKTFLEDTKGNLVRGNYFGMDTRNSIIYSESIPVTAVGVEDMIIAVTNDAALICPRNRAQDIKSLVGKLKTSEFSFLT